jgi:hypothetical protein
LNIVLRPREPPEALADRREPALFGATGAQFSKSAGGCRDIAAKNSVIDLSGPSKHPFKWQQIVSKKQIFGNIDLSIGKAHDSVGASGPATEIPMTDVIEGQVARQLLLAQQRLAKAEQGPINCEKLEKARQDEAKAWNDWHDLRNGRYTGAGR